MGLFTNYAELGQRNFTKWRSLATDVFVQDSWKPSAALTVEGGVRWVYWPPWYSTTNNIANFDPRFYSTATQAVIDPTTADETALVLKRRLFSEIRQNRGGNIRGLRDLGIIATEAREMDPAPVRVFVLADEVLVFDPSRSWAFNGDDGRM